VEETLNKLMNDLIKNQTQFVFVDKVNIEDEKFPLIPVWCIEEGRDAAEVRKLAEAQRGGVIKTTLKNLTTKSEKEKILIIPAPNDEIDSLDVIAKDYSFKQLTGRGWNTSFEYVLQLQNERDYILPPNTIAVIRTPFFLPGAAFPLVSTQVEINKCDDREAVREALEQRVPLLQKRRNKLDELFERGKKLFNNLTRQCVNGIEMCYFQLGSRQGKYGCLGGNASGYWKAKKGADEEEVRKLQHDFAGKCQFHQQIRERS
jgi:hypothetical protein